MTIIKKNICDICEEEKLFERKMDICSSCYTAIENGIALKYKNMRSIDIMKNPIYRDGFLAGVGLTALFFLGILGLLMSG